MEFFSRGEFIIVVSGEVVLVWKKTYQLKEGHVLQFGGAASCRSGDGAPFIYTLIYMPAWCRMMEGQLTRCHTGALLDEAVKKSGQ